jgi:heat shock protein HslJ
MKRQPIFLTALAVFLFGMSFFALVGCSDTRSSLDGTQWRLTEWTLSSLNPADFTITAKFTNGEVAGNSSVNSYSGPYKLGPGNAFSIGQVASTLMAGSEPAMRAETAYLTLLGQAKSYKVTDGKLTLYDQGGNESLIFGAILR